MRNTQRAFTLIELLVTITVTGLLAALLLSATQKMRMAGQNAQCVNNLRGAAAAVQMLASENNNVFRSWARGNNSTGSKIWGQQLLDDGFISQKKQLRCPSAADLYPLDNGAWYHNTYGFNMVKPDGTPTDPAGGGQTYELKLAAVPIPASRIMLVDTATLALVKPGVRSETFRVNINKSTDGVQLRHNNRLNAAFMDGHIEALNKERAKEFFKESIIYEANH